MLSLFNPKQVAAWALVLVLMLPCVALAATALPGPAQVIKSAACDGYKKDTPKDKSTGCNEEAGLAGFVGAANAIVSPAVIAMIAVAPIACLFGAGMLMFGNKRGMVTIGAALGVTVFLVSIKGIVE